MAIPPLDRGGRPCPLGPSMDQSRLPPALDFDRIESIQAIKSIHGDGSTDPSHPSLRRWAAWTLTPYPMRQGVSAAAASIQRLGLDRPAPPRPRPAPPRRGHGPPASPILNQGIRCPHRRRVRHSGGLFTCTEPNKARRFNLHLPKGPFLSQG